MLYLHAARDGVPLSPVRHAIGKVVTTVPPGVHVVVRAGIGLCHAEKLLVICN